MLGHNGFHGEQQAGAEPAALQVGDDDQPATVVWAENDPTSRDCGAPDRNASFDCYNAAYRCLARDVVCDQPLNTPGAKTNWKSDNGRNTGAESLRDVIAFPKTQNGTDLMSECPTDVSAKQLEELHIKVVG